MSNDPSAPSPHAQPGRRARPQRSRASTIVLLGLTGLAAMVFVSALVLVFWLATREKNEVAEGSFLELKLSGEIPDAPVVGGLFLDPSDVPPVLTEITDALRRAKDDERIDGLLLVIDDSTAGWAGAQELRDAIATFRASGKPCIAYAEMYTTGSYYIASACDRIVLAPGGVGMVIGLAASTTYYAGTFEKIGVQADMLHVGAFKSAVEPYERTGPSEPAAEAFNLLLDSLWGQFLSGVAAGRNRSTDEVQAWIDHPSLAARQMLEMGMVDALAYPDAVRARAASVAEEGWAASLAEPYEESDEAVDDRFTSMKKYIANLRESAPSSDAKVAVVYAAGPIVSGEADGGLFGGQMIGDRTFREWIDAIRKDDEIKAVVVRVNSPGGSGLASDMIWRELVRLKATGRPVVVSMGNYAASGGYYMSTPGQWIVAEPGTLTGSIGVFAGKLVFGGTYEKLGLTEATFKRGEQADMLSTTEPFTEEGRAIYQAFLDDFYEVFLGRVVEGRGMERDQVHEVAQGRVWTGEQALERHLVDELGGLDVAIAKAAELAELSDGYAIERWPKQKSFVEVLLEDLDGQSAARSLELSMSVPGVDAGGLADLFVLHRILADGPAALLPGHLTVR